MDVPSWIYGLIVRLSFTSISALLKRFPSIKRKTIKRKTALDIAEAARDADRDRYLAAIGEAQSQANTATESLRVKSEELANYKDRYPFRSLIHLFFPAQ